MTSRLANPTRLTMRRIDFSSRRWGQCRRVRYLKCEVVWRWSECGHSWQLSCSYEAFCLWKFVNVGKSRWVALLDGYKSTRGDMCVIEKPECERFVCPVVYHPPSFGTRKYLAPLLCVQFDGSARA